MKSTRRIRCLVCKRLVLPKEDQQSNVYKPFLIIPVTHKGIRGCICSDCFDNFCDEDFMSFDEDSNGQKKYTKKQSKIATEDVVAEFKEKYSCAETSIDTYVSFVQKDVFGQDEALERLVYTIYLNQMINFFEGYHDEIPAEWRKCFGGKDTLLRRKHVLLIGNTGVGKTFLATTVANTLGIVYSASNATPLTSAGYIGEKVENVLERLYKASGNMLDVAQNGIVIIDEFDKKAVSKNESEKDVAGKSVQQELLKILEPSDVWICDNSVKFNTSNLTVILMGAFVGLEKIIADRLKVKKIGFENKEKKVSLNDVTPDDIIKYGFIPEIVGRIPVILKLNDLTQDVLEKIAKQLLSRYAIFFKAKGFDLHVSDTLVTKIAEKSVKSKTGARDLDSAIDELLHPILYKVLQSSNGGICEISEDGSFAILPHSADNFEDSRQPKSKITQRRNSIEGQA